MANIVLGSHPQGLDVLLVKGDGKPLVATLVDGEGSPTDWPSAPSLEFATADGVVVLTKVATIGDAVATWVLTHAEVDALYAATLTSWGTPTTLARATLPDGDDGKVEYAGKVHWSDGWTAGDGSQEVTFTLPGGPSGPAGASAYEVAVANGFEGTESEWLASLGGEAAVTSVAGRAGAVVLTSTDVGLGNVDNTSDAGKPVSTAQAAADSAVAAVAATDATTKANAAQAAAIAASQPVDSDLTAIAALTTTAYGRAFLGLANQAALVGLLPSGTQSADTQSADTLTDGTTNKAFLATERTKLTGVATGATANSSDATLLARANHTGTQAISTVTGLQTALDGLAPIRAAINAQTGTTYTVVLSDENKLVTCNNAGAITVTLPSDATVAIPVSGRIDFAVLGAGMVTFVAGSGATANGTPSLVTRAQYSAASAIKIAANTWLVVGDLA